MEVGPTALLAASGAAAWMRAFSQRTGPSWFNAGSLSGFAAWVGVHSARGAAGLAGFFKGPPPFGPCPAGVGEISPAPTRLDS